MEKFLEASGLTGTMPAKVISKLAKISKRFTAAKGGQQRGDHIGSGARPRPLPGKPQYAGPSVPEALNPEDWRAQGPKSAFGLVCCAK